VLEGLKKAPISLSSTALTNTCSLRSLAGKLAMHAEDAADLVDQEKTADRFKQRAAVAIAILAMLLSITSLGGTNASKEAINNNVLASNFFNFYQATNMRQTSVVIS
jgi:hypothetical protein